MKSALCPVKLIFKNNLFWIFPNTQLDPLYPPTKPSHIASQPPTPSSSLGILPPDKFSVSNGSKSYIALKNSLNSKERILTVPDQVESI